MKPGRGKIVAALLAVSLFFAALAVVAIFRKVSILQYTAETVIRNILPEYVSVERVHFDLALGRASLIKFRIANPPGYGSRYLAEIDEISCRYRMKGKTILDGIEIVDPVFRGPALHIERRADGSVNISDMAGVLSGSQGRGKGPRTLSRAREEAQAKGAAAGRAYGAAAMAGKRAVSEIVKLPEEYAVVDGKMVFSDAMAGRGRQPISITGIDADVNLRMNDSYSQITNAGSSGSGYLNGKRDETVRWTVDYVPGAARLKMSNRFEVSNIEMKPFEPYYDRYSPLVFQSGRLSGTMVFDFDQGNIGSTNELRLSELAFSVKSGMENSDFWGTTVPELVKYFTTSTQDVVFDFKIKGDMANPRFLLGPVSKRALTSMVVDKISAALSAAAKASESGQGANESKEEAQARAVAEALKKLLKK